jgi:GNAT superfamily N-acetyltransferase
MELRQFGPDDLDDVRAYVEVVNAERAADSPWVHPLTEQEAVGQLRHGWDGEPDVPFLALDGGVVVGYAEYSTSEWDNQHLAWLGIGVHPERRRRGHGSAILAAMVERARAEGRTSVGTDGWDNPAAIGFAARHGLEQRSSSINRRQFPGELDHDLLDRLHEKAAPHAAAYELVRRAGRSPDEELAAIAQMSASINDAPTDDLDIEDEVYTAERIRNFEHAQEARGLLLHRVFARHRETGELAGHTVVVVRGERPHLADQEDTTVVRAHRGHRLGVLLKLDMLRWLAEEQPQVASLDTWNAESNDHMIGVNEQLGYRIVGRSLEFQRSI